MNDQSLKEGLKITKSRLRLLSEIIFLLIFSFMFWQGNIQAWALFWVVGIAVSLVFSRLYCGWVCPIGTFMRLQSWIYDKLNLRRYSVSSSAFITVLRLLFVAAFFAGMYAVRGLGWQLNIIMILVGAGLISSFFLSEDFWHRVCPHGTVLYVSTSPSKFSMNLDEDICTGCGLCEKTCPYGAITSREDSGIRKINNNECLTCHDCEKVCPVDAISYSS